MKQDMTTHGDGAVIIAIVAASVVTAILVLTSTQCSHSALAASATLTPASDAYIYIPLILRNYAGRINSPNGVWRPFNDESPWNVPLGKNPPIDSNSEAFIAYLNQHYREVGGSGEEPYIGCNITSWSIPVYFVDEINPYPSEIYVPAYTSWGEDLIAPIPQSAEPDPTSDAHLSIVDRELERAWGFWSLQGDYPDLRSGTGKEYNLLDSGARPPGEHGCRESGFPLIAGLIRPQEIQAGEIRHALVFAFDARDGSDQFVYPASHGANYDNSAASNVLPMGARLQLKPDTDISHFPRGARIVAQAMKSYGMYLGDENDSLSLSIYFQSNGNWDGLFAWEDRRALRSLTASDFRVIELPPIGGERPWYLNSTTTR